MLKIIFSSLMLCLASAIFTPQHALASSSVGRIVQAYGPAWVQNGAKRIKATKGMVVFRNDNIITGTRARVKIVMGDGSKVYIGTKSRVSLKEYSLEGKQLISATINMLWGKARFFVNKLVSKNSSFRVHTPTAVLGVRGTEFVVSVPASAELLAHPFAPTTLTNIPPLPTRTVLIEGSVNVSTNIGQSMLLTPGNTADVNASRQVSMHKTKSNDIDKHATPAVKPTKGSPKEHHEEGATTAPTPPSLPAPTTKKTEAAQKPKTTKQPPSIDTKPVVNAIQNLGNTTDITIQAGFVKP